MSIKIILLREDLQHYSISDLILSFKTFNKFLFRDCFLVSVDEPCYLPFIILQYWQIENMPCYLGTILITKF